MFATTTVALQMKVEQYISDYKHQRAYTKQDQQKYLIIKINYVISS
jgi:hypothetical protein